MGLALQAIVQCPGLSRVIAVELSKPRFLLAIDAFKQLVAARPKEFSLTEQGVAEDGNDRYSLEIAGDSPDSSARVLDVRLGDFLSEGAVSKQELEAANVIIMQ